MGPITANSKIHESDTVIPRVLGGLLVLVGVLIVSCALWMVWGISAERADRQAGRSYTEADEPMLEAERETAFAYTSLIAVGSGTVGFFLSSKERGSLWTHFLRVTEEAPRW